MKALALIAVLAATPAWAVTNPSSTKLQIYAAYMTLEGDCGAGDSTKLITLVDHGDTPQEFDMVAEPGLAEVSVGDAEGQLPPGAIYNCLIMVMDGLVTFVPEANDGTACVAGTSYTLEVCNNGTAFTRPDGTTGTCTGSGDKKVPIYISTWTDANAPNTANSFQPPTVVGDTSRGINFIGGADLTSATVQGLQFIFDANQKVGDTDNDGTCDMDQPKFGAREL